MLLPSLFVSLLLPLASTIFHENSDSSSRSESCESHESHYGSSREHHHHHHHDRRDEYYAPRPGPRPKPPVYYAPRPAPRPPAKPRCQKGWTFFQRPTGGWCLRVFAGIASHSAAVGRCGMQFAVLSGLQNKKETDWVVETTLELISQIASGSIWVGAKRRPQCIGKGLTATCTKTNSFYWTDKSITGTEAMKFQANSPDNKGGKQNCAVLFAALVPGSYKIWWPYTHQLDDVECEINGLLSSWAPKELPRRVQGYLCGKKSN